MKFMALADFSWSCWGQAQSKLTFSWELGALTRTRERHRKLKPQGRRVDPSSPPEEVKHLAAAAGPKQRAGAARPPAVG